MTALLPSSLPPRPGALLRGQLGHARRTSTSEAGYIAQVGLPRTTRGCTHARGSQLQLGGRSLCLVRPPRTWARANRQRHARAQHAEAARLAAAHAAPRMHAAHTRRTHASTRKRKWDGGGGSPRRARDGGWRARGGRTSRQSSLGWYSAARRAAHAREHPPHCHVRPLARSGCARSCWVVGRWRSGL